MYFSLYGVSVKILCRCEGRDETHPFRFRHFKMIKIVYVTFITIASTVTLTSPLPQFPSAIGYLHQDCATAYLTHQ
jgi:hypothetical protein